MERTTRDEVYRWKEPCLWSALGYYSLGKNQGDYNDQCIAKAKKYGQKYAATYTRNFYRGSGVYCEIGMTKGVLYDVPFSTERERSMAQFGKRNGELWQNYD